MNDISDIIPLELQVKLKEYLSINTVNICILTPCFGSICHTGYVTSLLKTMEIFKKLNVSISVEFCRNDSLVTRARNNLIARAMNDETITHFLFIDNDIEWEPAEIIKLLCHDKRIIGGVYPIKKYNWDKILKRNEENGLYDGIQQMLSHKSSTMLKDIITDENYIRHKLVNYNLNYLEGKLQIQNNIAKVKHIATGFMMIQRKTIQKMCQAFPSTKYTDDVNFLTKEENKYAYALFDCCIENETYYSEDWLFCNRWRNMGGDIYIDVTISLDHTGIEDYKGSYITNVV